MPRLSPPTGTSAADLRPRGSRTTDGGASWERARAVFAPRELKSTIGHQRVVRPTGELVDLFTMFQGSGKNRPGSSVVMMRSTDKGATWSAPQVVHKMQFKGAYDPDTGWPIRAERFIPEVAVDPHNGNLYAAWQDLRFSGVDQIAFSRSTDGGNTWYARRRWRQKHETPGLRNARDAAAPGRLRWRP